MHKMNEAQNIVGLKNKKTIMKKYIEIK